MIDCPPVLRRAVCVVAIGAFSLAGCAGGTTSLPAGPSNGSAAQPPPIQSGSSQSRNGLVAAVKSMGFSLKVTGNGKYEAFSPRMPGFHETISISKSGVVSFVSPNGDREAVRIQSNGSLLVNVTTPNGAVVFNAPVSSKIFGPSGNVGPRGNGGLRPMYVEACSPMQQATLEDDETNVQNALVAFGIASGAFAWQFGESALITFLTGGIGAFPSAISMAPVTIGLVAAGYYLYNENSILQRDTATFHCV